MKRAACVLPALILAGCGAAPFAPSAPQTSLTVVPAPAVRVTAFHSTITFNAIDFHGTEFGWVSGIRWRGPSDTPQPVLLSTSNGGQTWTSTQVPYDVIAVDFISAEVGWTIAEPVGCAGEASCGSRSILFTSDGGRQWKVQWSGASGATGTAYLQMEGAVTGYAEIGGRLLGTGDGGAQWTSLSLPGGVQARAMDWVSPSTGWVVGGPSCPSPTTRGCAVAVFFTEDSGRTWAQQLALNGPPMREFVSFANAEDGWLAVKAQDGQGTLYQTTDGGRVWAQESSSFLAGRLGPTAITFVSPQVGWVGVGSGAAPFALGVERTQDGGQSWTSHGNWSVGAVFPLSATDAWAIGSRLGTGPEFLVHTTDGGSHWTQAPINFHPTEGIDFLNGAVGFGIGSPSNPGAILRTATGGTSWTQVATLAGQRLQAVSFVDRQMGWVLTLPESPTGAGASAPLDLWRTVDGGQRWEQVGTISHGYLGHSSFLRFFSSTNGVLVVGGFPTAPVLRTTDGGATWHRVSSLQVPGASWSDFAFLNTRTAWRLQSEMVSQQLGHRAHMGLHLWLTTNGGVTWRGVVDATNTYQWQIGLSFASSADGWILLRDQGANHAHAAYMLLHTMNGGRTWNGSVWPASAHPSPLAGSDQVRMDFVTSNDGWILSAQGLCRTTDGGLSWAWVS